MGKISGGQYQSVLSSTKQTIQRQMYKLIWQPAATRRELVLEKYQHVLSGWHAGLVARKFEARDLRDRLRDEKTKVAMQPLFTRQLEAWKKGYADQTEQLELIEALYREFKDDDAIDLVCRLQDEQPMARWIAIHVIERRWEKLETFLVELLEDPAPPVRLAAHQALVKLSRGTDFGPAGLNPSTADIRAAQKHWRAYLEAQDREARPAVSER